SFVSDAFKEALRVVTDIVFRSVYFNTLRYSNNCVILSLYCRRESKRLGNPFDSQVTGDIYLACSGWSNLSDLKGRSWIFRSSEEIISFQVTFQFLSSFSLNVSSNDGVHICSERTTS